LVEGGFLGGSAVAKNTAGISDPAAVCQKRVWEMQKNRRRAPAVVEFKNFEAR